jgi:hypothetical protein
MKNKMEISEFIVETIGEDESILLADGFEGAFVGISRQFTNPPIAVYDRIKCIQILSKDMTQEEAEEYFQYNVIGSYVGDGTPAFIDILNFNSIEI